MVKWRLVADVVLDGLRTHLTSAGAGDEEVVQALPAQRADQALGEGGDGGVGPG